MPRSSKDFAGYKKCDFKRKGLEDKSLSEIIQQSAEVHFMKSEMALILTVMGIIFQVKLLMWGGTLVSVHGLTTVSTKPHWEKPKRWLTLLLALIALHYFYRERDGSIADELMMLLQSVSEFLFS